MSDQRGVERGDAWRWRVALDHVQRGNHLVCLWHHHHRHHYPYRQQRDHHHHHKRKRDARGGARPCPAVQRGGNHLPSLTACNYSLTAWNSQSEL